MSKLGHVLAVPEQAIVVCSGYMIHIMKTLDVSSMIKPKKESKVQSPKSNLAHFGLKSSKPVIVIYVTK